MQIPPALQERISKIKLVVLDNDGVLTDGRIILGDYGDELKFFDVQDGLGLVLLRRAGIFTAIISGKRSRVNKRRAKELGVNKLYQNTSDKVKVFEKLNKKFKVSPDQVCYVGDDLIDIPLLTRTGLGVAVANAVSEVKEAAHYVTTRTGGRGAVREVTDMILKGQGLWDKVTARYFQ